MGTELKDFDTIPVSFLVQKESKFNFEIPSFQRGYRWESKHVRDMLDDIFTYVTTNTSTQDNTPPYFLQPLVVRKRERENGVRWEVLDGQQRLTTLLLILKQFSNRINEEDREAFELYSIEYMERAPMDFDNLDASKNLDNFYLMKAKNVIKEWYKEKLQDNKSALDYMKNALYHTDNKKQVKFIWYVVEEDDNCNDLYAIKVFNRLNKGKISLTSSELIKALFYIKFKSSKINKLEVDRFSMEWDMMEKQFEKDDFWYFISDRKQNVSTRLDVLFDYVANVDYRVADSMDAYRSFQEKYDKESKDFEQLWEKVKQVYDTLLRWYEDPCIYNYVGYLVWEGMLPQQITEKIYNNSNSTLDEDLLISSLRELIKEKVNCKNHCKKTNRSVEDWEYNLDKDKIKELLLLFNIEAYNNAQMKFPYDKFKKEHWDVEHVDSQKDNNLQELEHKKDWIKLVLEQLKYEPNVKELYKKGEGLLNTFEKENAIDSGNEFNDFYNQVYIHYHTTADMQEDKHTINNLVLLNCGINRGYKNAPFPCKRTIIINNDIDGVFIPLCTRNVFLKYYTGAEKGDSQLDTIRWSDADKKAYQTQLLETLKYYL